MKISFCAFWLLLRNSSCKARTILHDTTGKFKITSKLSTLGSSLFNQYSACLVSHPMVTNVLTASALAVVADAVAQKIERSAEAKKNPSIALHHSFYRSVCISLYGAAVFGYFVQFWYRFLDMIVPKTHGMNMAKIATKVAINQLCMSPTLNTLFFTFVTFTRDSSSSLTEKIQSLKLKIEKDLVPTIINSCLYWGVVQSVNFGYIALRFAKYQLLYTNLAFTVWTVYLSLIGYRKVGPTINENP